METNNIPQQEPKNQDNATEITEKRPVTGINAVLESGVITRKELIEHLEESIQGYNDGYYNEGEAIIPDEHYDSQVEFLKSIDPDNALLLEIGASPRGQKITFDKPMKSLDKTDVVEHVILHFDPDYLMANMQGLKREDVLKKEILFSHKIDGIALKLHYKNGKLQWVSTRGNGYVGGLVDHRRIAGIQDIPQTVPYNVEWEAMGEVFMDKETFLLLQKDNPELTNARSLVTGTLLSDDADLSTKRPLRFFFYGANNFPEEILRESDLWSWAKTIGFTPVTHKLISVDDIKSIIDATVLERDQLPYFIDGMVFKENSIAEQAKYGETEKFPKHSIAFKIHPSAVLAEVSGVEWTIGRHGEIAPTIKIKPVDIEGLTVKNVYIHNITIYEMFGYPNIGDQVLVECRAGLLPKVRKLVKKVNNENPVPKICKICQMPLEVKYPNLLCTNDICNGKSARILEAHFNSRGIKGLGEKSVQKLIAAGIDSIDKFYDLTEITLAQYLKISEKHSRIIYASVTDRTRATDAMLLASMQILGIGIGTATHIFEKCYTLEYLLSLTREETEAMLRSVRGIGKARLADILSSLDEHLPTLKRMLSKLKKPHSESMR